MKLKALSVAILCSFTLTPLSHAAPGNPHFLDIAAVPTQAGNASEKALEVIGKMSAQLGVKKDDMVFKHEEVDVAGNTHVRLNQTYKGLPVEFATLTVHFNAAGQNQSLSGYSVANIHVDTTSANMDIRRLTSIATIHTAKLRQADLNMLVVSNTSLVIFNTGAIKGLDEKNVLAYKVNVQGEDPAVNEDVYIDANNGNVLASLTHIMDAKNRTIYNVNNKRTLSAAALARVEGQTATGNIDVDNAYDFSGDTYDFYKNGYARNSIDGLGMNIISYVHYKVGYQNAYWSGSYMVYGDGFTVDDVAGHELTHGVTQYTAALVYSYQSGALNESMSDIFGETVDQINGKGTDTAAVKWLMGEDIPGIGAIRSMANPPAYSDPDKVSSSYYYCGTSDNGGVHTNSGVPNKLFYLMTDGGTFNGYNVTPLGLTKAAAIHYQNLSHYLNANSQFADHRIGLTQSCKDLIGAPLSSITTGQVSGEIITQADCDAANTAMTAVELDKAACI